MEPTKSIYNKREIMRQAWTIYRRLGGLTSFATTLRNAWRLAKSAVRKAVEAAKKESAGCRWRRAKPPRSKPWLGCAKP